MNTDSLINELDAAVAVAEGKDRELLSSAMVQLLEDRQVIDRQRTQLAQADRVLSEALLRLGGRK